MLFHTIQNSKTQDLFLRFLRVSLPTLIYVRKGLYMKRPKGILHKNLKNIHPPLLNMYLDLRVLNCIMDSVLAITFPNSFTHYQSEQINKTCHRDRIARLTAPCPSHKKTLT